MLLTTKPNIEAQANSSSTANFEASISNNVFFLIMLQLQRINSFALSTTNLHGPIYSHDDTLQIHFSLLLNLHLFGKYIGDSPPAPIF